MCFVEEDAGDDDDDRVTVLYFGAKSAVPDPNENSYSKSCTRISFQPQNKRAKFSVNITHL